MQHVKVMLLPHVLGAVHCNAAKVALLSAETEAAADEIIHGTTTGN